MSTELQPCATCARHVARGTRTCPFCGSRDVASRHVPKNPSVRMALVAAAASAVFGEACTDLGGVEALYGVPCVKDACGPVEVDSGVDARAKDGAADSESDAATDSASDAAAADSGTDSGADSGTDSAADTGTDSPADAPADG